MARNAHRPNRPKPKVWHNPDVVVPGAPRRGPRPDREPEVVAPAPERRPVVRAGRIAPTAAAVDPREADRVRLLGRLLAAEGRSAVTRAAADLTSAGFELPASHQEAQMQLLEHQDEEIVVSAIEALGAILEAEAPKRFMVLESRLRRLEELADDPATATQAAKLRRLVLARRS